jgi:hypothetical protein
LQVSQELTETALNNLVPRAGALFQVIVPSEQVPFTWQTSIVP